MTTQTKGKHTAGPWTLVSENLKREFVIYSHNGLKEIAFPKTIVSQRNSEYWKNNKSDSKTLWEKIASEEEQANAQLIAAAPELLEALKQMKIAFNEIYLQSDYLDDSNICEEALKNANQAIAKAEGG